jgi:hypothetical protein
MNELINEIHELASQYLQFAPLSVLTLHNALLQ